MTAPGTGERAARQFAVTRALEGESNAVADAVVSTISYSDLFGYSPSADEITRYLHRVPADRAAVATAIRALVDSGELITDGQWYALPGREHFFQQRRSRMDTAADLWVEARRSAKFLASIPTVRMVAVTGSLAVDNTEIGADIDFMLIVDGGTLWRTRAMAKLMQLTSRRLGGNLCANYFLSDRALALEEESLYIAHELTQMIVLYGFDAYETFRSRNEWTRNFLPNAIGAPRDPDLVRPSRFIRRSMRPLVLSGPARRLERWECGRKLHLYNDTDFQPGRYSRYSREATGHRLNVRDQIEWQHKSRLRQADSSRPLRLLFGQSYHLYFDPKLWREMRPYPPLGSLYGAAVAREAGHEVYFFDSMLATSHTSWEMALDRHRPDVVVLFEDNFNYLTKMCLLRMRDAAAEMVASAKRIDAKVIVSSSDASDHARHYLDAGADYVIRGEGERVLLEVLRQIREPGKLDARLLPGVSFMDERREVVNNERMPIIRELDELPFPAWDLINLREYRNRWRRRHGRFSINLVTTRGCPYHCNWCAKPIWGQRYNSRSPQNVVAELAQLAKLIDLEHVWFMDDIFGLKPGWVQRFADCLEKNDVKIGFKCLTRSDLLRRPGEIEALARAGCETVWIGAESGSQKILDAMEKGTTVEDIEHTSARLREHGIRVGHFIQFGYPGETMSEIKSTIAMIRRVMPDELGISVSYPLPGTPFYERVKAQLGPTQNWQDSDDLAMLFRGPFRTEFYRCLHRLVHRDLAWRRTARQLRDGSFFRLAPFEMGRRLVLFSAYSLILPTSWLRLRVLSRRSDPSVEELPTELDRATAATPSDQSDDRAS